jgi:hypothetical protein
MSSSGKRDGVRKRSEVREVTLIKRHYVQKGA